MQAAIDATNAEGIRVVQIGAAGEYRYANVIDRRGFRWPIQVALLSGAEFFFGIEGSAAYAAYSVRCPALVSFGPTPACAFSFPGTSRWPNPSAARARGTRPTGTRRAARAATPASTIRTRSRRPAS